MALQKTIITPHGLTLTDAYIRIDKVELNKTDCQLVVNTYVNQQARLDKKQPVLRQLFKSETPLTGGVLEQLYIWLKANHFQGATNI